MADALRGMHPGENGTHQNKTCMKTVVKHGFAMLSREAEEEKNLTICQ